MQLWGKIARHVAVLRWDDTLDEKGTPLVDQSQHQEVDRQRRDESVGYTEECRQDRKVSERQKSVEKTERSEFLSISESLSSHR